MKNRYLLITFTLGLGLAIALVWLLGISGTRLPEARAASYTVCPAGPPTCDYSVIQNAVDAASDYDVIKVAAGTYSDINANGGTSQVVYIDKSVTIRGGFTTAFTDPQDPEANPTTLDAGGQGRVLYITGNINPTIEGLRITGGNAAALGGDGGGVYIGNATTTISANQVFGNAADRGGGVFLSFSPTTLYDNIISTNNAPYGGAGIFLDFSAATVRNNKVISNTGRGLFLWESDNAMLAGNTISNNIDGGIYARGDNVTISGNTLSFNTADWGGGVILDGGSISLNQNLIASNNSANDAGGIFLGDGNLTISGNTIISNTAGGGGGGLSLSDKTGVYTISNNNFSGNSASEGGGLALNSDNTFLINNFIVDNQATNCCGSGMYIAESSAQLIHNTIARNIGAGGIGLGVLSNSSVVMTNTILVSQTVGIDVQDGSTAVLEATLWGSGNWANGSDWQGGGTIMTGTVNLWGDPVFLDPDAGDYHIDVGSAAVDVGVDAGVTTDIDFHPRPYHNPDLGADEYWPPGTLKFVYLPVVLR